MSVGRFEVRGSQFCQFQERVQLYTVGRVKKRHAYTFINVDFKLVGRANLTPGCS